MPRTKKHSTKHRNKRKHTRKQKLYNMYGCSKQHKHTKSCYKKYKGGAGCGSCGCPIAPLSASEMNRFGGNSLLVEPCGVTGCKAILGTGQNGGNCGCETPMQLGGIASLPTIPGPFVGKPWGPEPNQWPGANFIQGDRNYNAPMSKVIDNDPALKMQLNQYAIGGKRRNRNKSKKRSLNKKGGGLIPQDLVNLGRNFTYNLNSAYNILNGYKPPVDPMPYKGQLTQSSNPKL
jgi:hypothetical protein